MFIVYPSVILRSWRNSFIFYTSLSKLIGDKLLLDTFLPVQYTNCIIQLRLFAWKSDTHYEY